MGASRGGVLAGWSLRRAWWRSSVEGSEGVRHMGSKGSAAEMSSSRATKVGTWACASSLLACRILASSGVMMRMAEGACSSSSLHMRFAKGDVSELGPRLTTAMLRWSFKVMVASMGVARNHWNCMGPCASAVAAASR